MSRFLKLLAHDFVGIFGFALIGALLPDRAAFGWLGLGARLHRWHPDVDAAEEAAARCWARRNFDRRAFRRVILTEACTAWRLVFRRNPRVEFDGTWPRRPGFVAVGGHAGNGIAVLWSLHARGLRPRFVLHAPDRGQIRRRPVMYLWMRIRFRLIRRLCPDSPIVTGGARRRLADALDEGGSTPVILLDTPCPSGESDWRLPLGAGSVYLRTGALPVIREGGTRVVLFDARAAAAGSGTAIEVYALEHADDLRTAWPAWFGARLEHAPEHWHLWPFVGPQLQESPEESVY